MENILEELIQLSEQKEISYSRKQLEKMSEEKLASILKEYKRKELDDFNEAMTDCVIFKFEELMKKYQLVKEDSKLGKKLQDKKLFRKDLETTISYISPYLPFIGFLEGGVCVASEVIDKFAEEVKLPGNDIPDLNEEDNNKEDDAHQEESGDS